MNPKLLNCLSEDSALSTTIKLYSLKFIILQYIPFPELVKSFPKKEVMFPLPRKTFSFL